MSSSAEASSIAMAAGSVRDSNFYLGFAIVSAVMVFTGFSRSFYLKPYFNTPRLPLLFQVHGSVFTLWVLFFVAQAWLAWDGRFNLHRQMGTAGAVLAGLAVILGVAIAFVSSGMGHFNKIPGAGDPAEACCSRSSTSRSSQCSCGLASCGDQTLRCIRGLWFCPWQCLCSLPPSDACVTSNLASPRRSSLPSCWLGRSTISSPAARFTRRTSLAW